MLNSPACELARGSVLRKKSIASTQDGMTRRYELVTGGRWKRIRHISLQVSTIVILILTVSSNEKTWCLFKESDLGAEVQIKIRIGEYVVSLYTIPIPSSSPSPPQPLATTSSSSSKRGEGCRSSLGCTAGLSTVLSLSLPGDDPFFSLLVDDGWLPCQDI